MDKDNYIITFPKGMHLEANALHSELEGKQMARFLSGCDGLFCTLFVGKYASSGRVTTQTSYSFKDVVWYCEQCKDGVKPLLYGGEK